MSVLSSLTPVTRSTRRRVVLAIVLAVAVVGGLLVLSQGRTAQAAPILRDGFVLKDIDTGLSPGDQITDFGYLPDETLLVTGKKGKITWVPHTGAPRQIAMLSANPDGDLGLTGFAVAPDYATSRAVYTGRAVLATGPGAGQRGYLRLSRWTVTTDAAGAPTGLTDEQVLVQASADSNVHGVGSVVAAEDGTVWVAFGDSARWEVVDDLALRSLDIDDLHGKVLRVRADGTGVPTNPYYDAANPRSNRSLVYASGFRSPFRFSIEPLTGRPILGDVGMTTREEVNFVTAGTSYGWPCWEGTARTPQYANKPECANVASAAPLWSYPRDVGTAVTGGVVYTGTSYPDDLRGRYFFGDYTQQNYLWTLGYNEQGALVTPPETGGFGRNAGLPVKFGTVPTGGDVVFADIGSGKIRRLVYAPGDQPPTAALTSTVDAATRTVSFDASGSHDPNGDALEYAWSFGDGGAGTGATVSHTYGAGESFTVTLTVREKGADGKTGTATTVVHPGNHPPALTIEPPDPAHKFSVGEVIAASGTATDQEDGELGLTWSATLVHCHGVGNCHDHPGVEQPGPNFSLPFEGHPGDTRLEITVSATDSLGAVSTETFVVQPLQRRITIASNTPASFTIGDQAASSGLFTVGSTLSVTAPETAHDGVATFGSWADGTQGRERTVTLTDADLTLAVTYLTPIDRRYVADSRLRAAVGTPTTVEQGDSTVRWREYTTGRVYWSPSTDVRYVRGGILQEYLRNGGPLGYGLPTTDETAGADGRGTYNLFTANQWGGRSIYWHPSVGTRLVYGFIYERYKALGAEGSVLGYPLTSEAATPDGGRFNDFQAGSIYFSNATGAHEVHGAIRTKWKALGATASVLGYPITDETPTRVGGGAYNDFRKGPASWQVGSIYWSPGTGAVEVHGAIWNRWNQLDRERSYLGLPKRDEYRDAAGNLRSDFVGGYIVFYPATQQVRDYRY